jgi:hypothetical protein
MTIPRRRCPRPVPYEPSHRRTWRSLWRRCSCGLPSPCVDRLVPAPPLPFPPNRVSPADRRSTASDGTHPPTSTSARIQPPRASPIRPAQPRYDTAPIARISPSAYLETCRAASLETNETTSLDAGRTTTARRPAWPIAGRIDAASGRHRAGPYTDRAACARDPTALPAGTASWARPGSHDRRPGGAAPPDLPSGPSGFIRVSDATVADTATHAPAWAGPTMLLSQVGRAGDLTPAQAYRAGQGPRW